MKNIILAADIGGTTCKLGIFDTKLERLHKWSIETDTSDHTGRTLLRQVFDSFKEATESYHFDLQNVIGVGIEFLVLLILKRESYMGLLIYIGLEM